MPEQQEPSNSPKSGGFSKDSFFTPPPSSPENPVSQTPPQTSQEQQPSSPPQASGFSKDSFFAPVPPKQEPVNYQTPPEQEYPPIPPQQQYPQQQQYNQYPTNPPPPTPPSQVPTYVVPGIQPIPPTTVSQPTRPTGGFNLRFKILLIAGSLGIPAILVFATLLINKIFNIPSTPTPIKSEITTTTPTKPEITTKNPFASKGELISSLCPIVSGSIIPWAVNDGKDSTAITYPGGRVTLTTASGKIEGKWECNPTDDNKFYWRLSDGTTFNWWLLSPLYMKAYYGDTTISADRLRNPPPVNPNSTSVPNWTWKVARMGEINASKPVVSGLEIDGSELYVCRAVTDKGFIPGKLSTKTKSCSVPYDGREIGFTQYEVLDAPKVKWITLTGAVPSNAILGGTDSDGEDLYICSARIDSMTSGKYKSSHDTCYVPFNGEEKSFKEVQLLVSVN